MRRLFLFLVILAGLLPGAGCRREAPPPPEISTTPPPVSLRIGVASSATAVPELISAPFAAFAPHITPQFVVANAETLLADLATGQLDAVLVHALPAETNLWFNPVALDGLALIVHPDNPVENLSRADAQAIFSGQITNWSAVGGPDLPITLLSRERGSGTRALFTQRILGTRPISINTQVLAGDAEVIKAVAANPGAIGYSMLGARNGAKRLASDGIPATPATVADQSYPLTAPLYFAARSEPQDELRAFLAWLQADAGQAALGARYGRVR